MGLQIRNKKENTIKEEGLNETQQAIESGNANAGTDRDPLLLAIE